MRKEKSSSHIKDIEEQGFQLTLEMAKLKKLRDEQGGRYAQELTKMVQKVATQVDLERD